MTTTATYTVAGMSCEHCVKAVSDEVRKLAGVSTVHVDLDLGTLEIVSEHTLDRSAVAAAIDEAGYELLP